MATQLNKKVIFVTGATGTVGSAIIKLLSELPDPPNRIIGVDNREQALFDAQLRNKAGERVIYKFLDIKDVSSVRQAMVGVDFVLHCAAMKHVSICEVSPDQTVANNITGTQNIIDAARLNGVSKVLFTSSDKAVNPTNVMGTTKLMGERLMTAANNFPGSTVFASTRFGNVVGSSGSVVPIFVDQAIRNNPITLTHKEMTRFIMSVSQAADLVINSLLEMRGGEVFVTKMPVVNVMDLGVAIWEIINGEGSRSTLKFHEIGVKPGEKLFEELMTSEELRRTIELKDYFCVLPAFRGFFPENHFMREDVLSDSVTNPYNSAEAVSMSVAEIKGFFNEYKIMNNIRENTYVGRSWPGESS